MKPFFVSVNQHGDGVASFEGQTPKKDSLALTSTAEENINGGNDSGNRVVAELMFSIEKFNDHQEIMDIESQTLNQCNSQPSVDGMPSVLVLETENGHYSPYLALQQRLKNIISNAFKNNMQHFWKGFCSVDNDVQNVEHTTEDLENLCDDETGRSQYSANLQLGDNSVTGIGNEIVAAPNSMSEQSIEITAETKRYPDENEANLILGNENLRIVHENYSVPEEIPHEVPISFNTHKVTELEASAAFPPTKNEQLPMEKAKILKNISLPSSSSTSEVNSIPLTSVQDRKDEKITNTKNIPKRKTSARLLNVPPRSMSVGRRRMTTRNHSQRDMSQSPVAVATQNPIASETSALRMPERTKTKNRK